MCDFCNNDIYSNISDDYDWEITSYKSYYYYYLTVEHTLNLGDLGSKSYTTDVKINYCPICGRKLEDELL